MGRDSHQSKPVNKRAQPVWLATIGITLVLVVVALLLPGVTAGPTATAEFPDGLLALRVYYDHADDIQSLQGYDLWSVNNLQNRYVLVGGTSETAAELQAQGWRVTVDERATADIARPRAASLFNDGYRTVEELTTDLNQLAAGHPSLATVFDYGDSHCKTIGGCVMPDGEPLAGHDLLAVRITNDAVPGSSTIQDGVLIRGDKPVFFLMANIHAREITTPELAMRFAGRLLETYGEDPDITWIVDWHEIWVVPTANPDGHWLVELGEQPPYGRPFFQRKNLNNDTDKNDQPDCSQWPVQSSWQFGVDLNRNHSFAWGPPGSSSDPCNALFRGPEPASEVETQAIEALVRTLIPDQRGEALSDPAPPDTTGLLITVHSYGNLVLWPWGYTSADAPNRPDLKAIGDRFAIFNGYLSCQPTQECLYGANGATDDWAYGELGIPAFTFEVGNQFMPPYSEIDDIQWPANWPALLHAAKLARTPYLTIHGPEVSDIVVSGLGDGVVQVRATVSDTNNGNDAIAAARLSVGLPTWSDAAEFVVMQPEDGAFDSPLENVVAQLDLKDTTDPQLVFYVEGQDAPGFWGTTAAVFVDNTVTDPLFELYIPTVVQP